MLPSNLRPIRLSRRSEPFDSEEFLFELKIDGFRALAYIENGECRLVSRNGKKELQHQRNPHQTSEKGARTTADVAVLIPSSFSSDRATVLPVMKWQA